MMRLEKSGGVNMVTIPDEYIDWMISASDLIRDPHCMSEPCKREFASRGAKLVDDYLEQKLEELWKQ
jgi:hypothetical protein